MFLLMARYGTIWLFWMALVGHSFAQNPYYDHGTFPATGTLGTSAGMRAELDLIEAGFSKLPSLSGNANKTIVVNGGATGLTATDAPIPSVTEFPLSPSTNALVFVMDDSSDGACDSSAGSSVSLCRWDGTAWVAVTSSGGVTGWPAVNSGPVTWANSFLNALQIGDGTGAWAIGRDPTDGLFFDPICGGVRNGCNFVRKLVATFYWEIRNAAGTSIFRVSNDTGSITNATLDVEATGNTVTIKNYPWRPFASCQNGVASAIWGLPTSNAPTAVCKGSNTPRGVLEFADGATDLSTTIEEYLNEDWTAAIEATLLWESASTSGNNVLWSIAIACAGVGESSDPVFTDDDFTADANNTAANTYNVTAVNTVTTTGTCTAGKMAHIRVKRKLSSGLDTLTATAQAVGLSLKLRSSQ